MAYLQVRDFPEELHDQLKLLARNEHRSVSQQTVIAIKEHVSQAAERAKANQIPTAGIPLRDRGEINYLERRMNVFERIRATPKPKIKLTAEDIVRTIQEGRTENDARIGL